MNVSANWYVTFCILSCGRIAYLKRCLSSIREYCPIRYSIKILSQGPASKELMEMIGELHDDIELIISPINLGIGGGRQLLSRKVTSSLIMMMDDDVYLTEGTIAHALKAFEQDHRIGAVGMPLARANRFQIECEMDEAQLPSSDRRCGGHCSRE